MHITVCSVGELTWLAGFQHDAAKRNRHRLSYGEEGVVKKVTLF